MSRSKIIEEIAAERERQVSGEADLMAGDAAMLVAEYRDGEIPRAAACFALPKPEEDMAEGDAFNLIWPWGLQCAMSLASKPPPAAAS